MGYTLTIGELEVEYDNKGEHPDLRLTAKGASHEDAPAFGEPTDHTNERWPSYTVWSDCCEQAGISELMFGEHNDNRLIYSHPGCVPITENHRKEINKAMDTFMIKYPDAVATYGEKQDHPFEGDDNNPEENLILCRLTWLHYWTNWALDNCEKPVFENT